MQDSKINNFNSHSPSWEVISAFLLKPPGFSKPDSGNLALRFIKKMLANKYFS
jgi:hypothetical protein